MFLQYSYILKIIFKKSKYIPNKDIISFLLGYYYFYFIFCNCKYPNQFISISINFLKLKN
jgi:hypothetical protein